MSENSHICLLCFEDGPRRGQNPRPHPYQGTGAALSFEKWTGTRLHIRTLRSVIFHFGDPASSPTFLSFHSVNKRPTTRARESLRKERKRKERKKGENRETLYSDKTHFVGYKARISTYPWFIHVHRQRVSMYTKCLCVMAVSCPHKPTTGTQSRRQPRGAPACPFFFSLFSPFT